MSDLSPFTVHHFESLGSTNDYLKALREAPEYTVIVADRQTAGRGRRDRSWVSTHGQGLYVSLLLKPVASASALSLISLFSGLAVAETLVAHDVPEVDIKWPNDVLIGTRKVAGILCEGASAGATNNRVVVGIGLNLNHETFPDEIAQSATSLFLATGLKHEAHAVLDSLLIRLKDWYEVWSAGGGEKIILRWQESSSFAFGAHLTINTDDEEVTGVTAGLSLTGGLNLRTDSGLRTMLSGEVSRLRKVVSKN